jgi:hypothetical protein
LLSLRAPLIYLVRFKSKTSHLTNPIKTNFSSVNERMRESSAVFSSADIFVFDHRPMTIAG